MKTNVALRVGLITGILSATIVQIAFALLDFLNTQYSWEIPLPLIRGIVGLFSIVFLGVGIYIGMEKSRRSNDGAITWWQAALTGILIALIVAIISACGAMIFSHLNPDFFERINGVSKEEFSPATLILQAFTGQFLAGMMISIVMAIFISRKINH